MSLDPIVLIVIAAALALLVGAVGLMAGRRLRDPAAETQAQALGETLRQLADAQAKLEGRLSHFAEAEAHRASSLADRMQAQERYIAEALDKRLGEVQRRVGESLEGQAKSTAETLNNLRERLSVIDAAQKNITELSTQVVGLHDVLNNKQARGAFGEVQLDAIIRAALPPSAFGFQVQVGEGRRVDCLIRLPNPPGPIAIDSKFPLDAYRALAGAQDEATRTQAARQFASDVRKHITDIAERYIVPGETADSALMFLPSEAVYAELHANFSPVVEEGYRRRVWIVSPTTLWATLTTIRAVLKDVRMREQAGVIQAEVRTLMTDMGRLDERVENLRKHFGQANRDIDQIATSTRKIMSRGEKIEALEMAEAEGEDGPLSLEDATGRVREGDA